MPAEPQASKWRHIMSSINPVDSRPTSEIDDATDHRSPPPQEPSLEESSTKRKSSKFRFKSSHSRSHRSSRHGERDNVREYERDHDTASSSSLRQHRRHHHHRHKRELSRSLTPTIPTGPPPLDAEAAFRESLFDAMADDEGAAYWENVYGQPIHTYSNARPGAEGELEKMDDDEYARYVRKKMWEKTHEGLLEERAWREEMKKTKQKREDEAYEQTRQMEYEAAKFSRDVEESLRRGEERRQKRRWKTRWDYYLEAWANWNGAADGMSWPVKSGQRDDISGEDVRNFFINGLDPREIGEAGLLAKLKEERVRWHPDKMQQKSGNKLDENIIKDVTAVFQIIDKLWADTRPKAK